MSFLSLLIYVVAKALHSKNISPVSFARIVSIVFIYAGVLSSNAFFVQTIGQGIGIYSGLFEVSSISLFIDILIFFIGGLILVSWPSISKTQLLYPVKNNLLSLQKNTDLHTVKLNNAGEYSLIVLFSTIGASLLISSGDLISMYLSIELQSFGVYILSSIFRDSESSTFAGLKYFLLGGLSSCIILLGSVILYSYTGLTNFESIYSLVAISDGELVSHGLSLGFILIILGFLFKIGAAPLHNWSPDVYEDTPTIVTIWLTIMPKISIIIFLLELFSQIDIIGNNVSMVEQIVFLDTIKETSSIFISFSDLKEIVSLTNNLNPEKLIGENTGYIVKNLLLISSLLSLIIGTIVGLAQTKLKRLLTYSTISHVGFILLALAINSEQSIDSLIFYIVQYTITNLNTFLIILGFGYILKNIILIKNSEFLALGETGTERDIKEIKELTGQFFSNPLLSISLTICLFSMAGIPPLMGFFGKQFVLYSAIQSGYYFMSIVGIIVSVISASYYLKIIKVLHSSKVEEETNSKKSGICDSFNHSIASLEQLATEGQSQSAATKITNFHSFLISGLTLSILIFILKPSILLNSTQLLSLSLFCY
ncbi:NADH dehydrogenase subunit 2 (mitochondrion) [Phanerochaete sordida]|uniref:NADH-ubiquinone oxidoreductase chain 2 n=1 Tax=Phanerochaete sordida TaxID=48140 RepID=A0A9N7KZ67_9APHY|nr:NADH dehydrogenase subunit 2 [Phanerochaete sordida]